MDSFRSKIENALESVGKDKSQPLLLNMIGDQFALLVITHVIMASLMHAFRTELNHN
jgi:hypothetical protein